MLLISISGVSRAAELCNGAETLCVKRYNEVTFPGTHNSMSNADGGWMLPNHFHGIEKQIEDGIRYFNIDIYMHGGRVHMCHASCMYGNRPLIDALKGVAAFMKSHPREVVTLDFSDDLTGGADVAAVFTDAGLAEYAHAQKSDEPWPTLGEMTDSGRRLVVFGYRRPDSPDWFLNLRDFVWDSPYDFQSVSEFECGTAGNAPLYRLSQFLGRPYQMPELARRANAKKTLVNRAVRCWKETGRRPNFIIVDFYTEGDLFGAVDYLNNLDTGAQERDTGR